MKLVLTIVPPDEADRLVGRLIEHEFRVTRINSAGGFLKKGSATLVVGVEDEFLEDVIALIRQGGRHASVFVLNVARFERL
ncbi:MAG TPA: cyclic-di-AMP receptor [Chloroflexota bacterium]|nr:cyclic-di-AMP receptor [Chloroflexota bacterium]